MGGHTRGLQTGRASTASRALPLQLLGGILFASGAAGVWGGRRRNSSMVNLHLLGCLLGTLLAFSLVTEVRSAPSARWMRPGWWLRTAP